MPSKLSAGLLTVLVCTGAVPTRADEDLPATALRPGAPLERRLTATEVHAYAVELTASSHRLVAVEQQGIDVVVEATMPDGENVAVDAPTYRHGTESLLLPAGVTGIVRIEVRAASKAVGPGRYEITVRELAATTAEDRRRLKAEAAMGEGARLNHQGTADARRQAFAQYVEALASWRDLEDRRG